MNVIDYKTSKIYTIEAKLEEFDVIEVKDKYAHSDHFIHPHFPYYFSYPQSNTLFRLAKVNELLGSIEEKNATIEDLIKILGYHDESYYNSIQSYAYMNKNITACTFLYSTKTKEIKVLSHLDETILCLDYKKLVEKIH